MTRHVIARRAAAYTLLFALCWQLTGCITPPSPRVQRDATAALLERADFPAAARASPGWVSAALNEITRLEAELERTEK